MSQCGTQEKAGVWKQKSESGARTLTVKQKYQYRSIFLFIESATIFQLTQNNQDGSQKQIGQEIRNG